MKRSYDEMNDSDDEVLLGRRTLPVANLPADFDGIPLDGMQYLFTVRRDAKLLPKFTRAPLPSESKQQSTSNVLKLGPVETASITPLLPSQEWRSIFVSNFKNLRKNCEPLRDPDNAPSRQPEGGPFGTKSMPDRKERDKWRAFIDGHPENVWNPPRKPKPSKGNNKSERLQARRDLRQTYNDLRSFEYGEGYRSYETGGYYPSQDSVIVVNEYGDALYNEQGRDEAAQLLPTPSRTPQPEEPQIVADDQLHSGAGPSEARSSSPQGISPRQPTPQLICKMDSRYCLHLLMYFTYWIDMHLKQDHPRRTHLSQTDARWMFALLCQVDAQLSSDEMSQMRNLARSCLALIKDLRRNPQDYEANEFTTGEPVDEKACWLVVTAILEFWVQRDLWMDAEDLMRK